jgi:hypothetical protein
MNMKDAPRRNYAIDQFTQPQCGELKGRSFRFVMDDGYDHCLTFTDEATLTWRKGDGKSSDASYQCSKSDDDTYLVDYEIAELENTPNRENHLFVIDLEQRLVTRGIHKIGENPKFPLLVTSKYTFGAIDVDGYDLPFARHCWTAELIGTRVEWHWNPNMITRHSYYTTGFYRFSHPGEELILNRDASNLYRALPSSDDVAQYIKIKDKMYLFVLTEEMSERLIGFTNPQFRSNNMAFLQNYDRMYHVGRTFGTILDPETQKNAPCHIRFGAFGNPFVMPETILNEVNPYTV